MTMADGIVVMKDGIIQQVDTPNNLYNHTCNLFVAGFIGSPEMNFIDAIIQTVDNKYYACFNNYKLPIPERMYENLEFYIEKEVVLGIRPEDFHNEEYYFTEDKSN